MSETITITEIVAHVMVDISDSIMSASRHQPGKPFKSFCTFLASNTSLIFYGGVLGFRMENVAVGVLCIEEQYNYPDICLRINLLKPPNEGFLLRGIDVSTGIFCALCRENFPQANLTIGIGLSGAGINKPFIKTFGHV